ncbi:MAG: nucleoside monophosphate kinase [Candidatus Portnoybacteria bacterium]|nr:nucleoside monophosphate kinase [Candidatus Portnoybacteria bacterium]
MTVIILLGRSGSGKGTQAKRLVTELGFEYIGSGELLRSFYEGQSFSAKKTRKVMNKGGFVPTPLIFWLWMERLETIKQEGRAKGIIFDGSPRKVLEAQLLYQALEWYEWEKNTHILLIDISRKEAFARLTKRRICISCGKLVPWVGEYKRIKTCDGCGGELKARTDDTPEAIKGRLNEFEKETLPEIEYYKKSGR